MMVIDWVKQKLWERYYKKKIELFKKYYHIDIVREKILETSEYKEYIEYETRNI